MAGADNFPKYEFTTSLKVALGILSTLTIVFVAILCYGYYEKIFIHRIPGIALDDSILLQIFPSIIVLIVAYIWYVPEYTILSRFTAVQRAVTLLAVISVLFVMVSIVLSIGFYLTSMALAATTYLIGWIIQIPVSGIFGIDFIGAVRSLVSSPDTYLLANTALNTVMKSLEAVSSPPFAIALVATIVALVAVSVFMNLSPLASPAHALPILFRADPLLIEKLTADAASEDQSAESSENEVRKFGIPEFADLFSTGYYSDRIYIFPSSYYFGYAVLRFFGAFSARRFFIRYFSTVLVIAMLASAMGQAFGGYWTIPMYVYALVYVRKVAALLHMAYRTNDDRIVELKSSYAAALSAGKSAKDAEEAALDKVFKESNWYIPRIKEKYLPFILFIS